MDPTLEQKKKILLHNIIYFLQEELERGNLNEDKKESIEVATQCLETAFDLDSQTRENLETINLIDLITVVPQGKPKVEVSEENKIKAEDHKNHGNTNMKNCKYLEAVDQYTKAIELNPNNAIYYCNRAAAFSRLEKHNDAIHDCNEAIQLDPTYGKAYGRLGIAYSNLNKYDLASKALKTALKYDPNNSMYETNLKLAEEKLFVNIENAAPPEHRPLDISEFINNPNIINMATQMLSDPNFCNIMSGLMGQSGGAPNMDAMLQVGQTLATRMQSADPNFVESLRRSFGGQSSAGPNHPNGPNQSSDQSKDNTEKKAEQ